MVSTKILTFKSAHWCIKSRFANDAIQITVWQFLAAEGMLMCHVDTTWMDSIRLWITSNAKHRWKDDRTCNKNNFEEHNFPRAHLRYQNPQICVNSIELNSNSKSGQVYTGCVFTLNSDGLNLLSCSPKKPSYLYANEILPCQLKMKRSIKLLIKWEFNWMQTDAVESAVSEVTLCIFQ